MRVYASKHIVVKNKSVETLERCKLTFWLFKKPPTGNPPMKRERVIVLKAENIRALAPKIHHWLKAHANDEFLWSKTSEEKGEVRCEIHYISDDVDPPEE